ncbi:aldo/keto reductase [Sphingomonas sp.]|uniref:aldo/keto reductase n=1 Tax=Sphingomonas sp. TaxID=28214 RepID=UPI003B3AA3CB
MAVAVSPLMARLTASGPFGFGASSLGNLYVEVSDEAAQQAVDAAWAAGVRYFDTAPFYGFGLSEQRLGGALRHRQRDAYLLSTKAGRLLVPTDEVGERHGFRSALPFTAVYDYSYDGVMRSVEESLNRLDLTHIDILYLHDLGRATHGAGHTETFAQAVNGGFRAMTELREQGVVGAIGLGVNEIAICAETMAYAAFDAFLIAGRYSLLDQTGGPFFQLCLEKGIAIVAAGIFASGVLAVGADDPLARYDYAPLSPKIQARVAEIQAICSAFGVPLAAAAYQFARAHPAVALPLLGLRTADQVHEAATFATMPIPSQLWDRLGLQARSAQPQPI